MALTASTMLPLNTHAPDFSLLDTVSGKTLSLQQLKSDKATVIMFICNHCPFVQHIQHKLVEVSTTYQKKGIQFIAISSNDVTAYPEDGPSEMKKIAQQFKYPFPYLFDPTQEVARAYQAACTPDFYIFNKDLSCVYRGRFDDSSPNRPTSVTGSSLTQALDCILSGKPIDPHQIPSQGCNIKWSEKQI